MFFPTRDEKEFETSSSSSSSIQGSQSTRHFDFFEIQLATNYFDESLVIGHGGFGKVYKGNVINGASLVTAAIKRLDPMSSQGAAEFWTEVEMLSKLRHCNLVSLIGHCNYEKELILVYGYMPNGTLEDHLHKLGTTLSWVRRLKICISAGRVTLSSHCSAAKISDFGLSRTGPTNQASTYVNTGVKGTFGYLDPDYSFTGRLTRKSDVYSFGVVLLEVLCRKRALCWDLTS
ncbi:receptor-like protein kinase FERONIA, partial [Tanacetum coccineum]